MVIQVITNLWPTWTMSQPRRGGGDQGIYSLNRAWMMQVLGWGFRLSCTGFSLNTPSYQMNAPVKSYKDLHPSKACKQPFPHPHYGNVGLTSLRARLAWSAAQSCRLKLGGAFQANNISSTKFQLFIGPEWTKHPPVLLPVEDDEWEMVRKWVQEFPN
jgi:hypothetical protein